MSDELKTPEDATDAAAGRGPSRAAELLALIQERYTASKKRRRGPKSEEPANWTELEHRVKWARIRQPNIAERDQRTERRRREEAERAQAHQDAKDKPDSTGLYTFDPRDSWRDIGH